MSFLRIDIHPVILCLSLFATMLPAVMAQGPQDEWMLVGMQGQCIPMSKFDTYGPPVRTPEEFYVMLKAEGLQATLLPQMISTGKASFVEVTSGGQTLKLLFTTAVNCGGSQPIDVKGKN